MVMKKQGISRRRFLAFCGGGITGIWLAGTGLVRLPDTVVFAMSGSCSFCGKEAREIFGLAGVTYRNVRICDECINLCLEIIVEETDIKFPYRRGLNPTPTDSMKVSMTRSCSPNWFVASQLANVATG